MIQWEKLQEMQSDKGQYMDCGLMCAADLSILLVVSLFLPA